jgi:hypothetical protein
MPAWSIQFGGDAGSYVLTPRAMSQQTPDAEWHPSDWIRMLIETEDADAGMLAAASFAKSSAQEIVCLLDGVERSRFLCRGVGHYGIPAMTYDGRIVYTVWADFKHPNLTKPAGVDPMDAVREMCR